jgi:hypothetical protein
MKSPLILRLSLLIGIGLTGQYPALMGAVTVSGSMSSSASSQTAIPVNPAVSYASIRLAPNDAMEADLYARKITNSGRVLLGAVNSTYSAGSVVGERWYQGELTPLYTPTLSFWENTTLDSCYLGVADMNDGGAVVGSASSLYATAYGTFDEYGLYWAAGSSNGAQMQTLAQFQGGLLQTRSATPGFISSGGIVYGNLYYDTYPFGFWVNDGLVWASPQATPARQGSGYINIELNEFSLQQNNVVAQSSGGQLLKSYASLVRVPEDNWDGYLDYGSSSYKIGSWTVPAGASNNLYSPIALNDSLRFVGKYSTSGELAWGEPQGQLVTLEKGIPIGINNEKTILALTPDSKPLLWRWIIDPVTNVGSYKKYGLRVLDSIEIASLTSINDSSAITSKSRRIIDDSGILLPQPGPWVPSLLIPAELAVDANRDGRILLSSETFSYAESDVVSKAKPFRFWSNDDNDGGSIDIADIPGQGVSSNVGGVPTGADYRTWTDLNGNDAGLVQGARDLVDYFPVYLDIKQLLAVLPPSGTIKYKLKQADGALNFVYTNLTRTTAFDYQRKLLTSGFGPALTQSAQAATKYHITPTGIDVFGGTTGSAGFLDAIQNHDGGVVMIDCRAATNKPTDPLVLSIEKTDGTVIAEVKLELKISPIEDMFRHLNLRDGAGAAAGIMGYQHGSGKATRLGVPAGLPDNDANQPWFVFVVGSNVDGEGARGWESETFKRLYWSRGDDGKFSKTRFLGVSWFGDPYANGSDGVYDYHLAVRNAFATAPALASAVNNLTGTGSKTIGGHSLACGLISAALSDHGMNVAHATLIDAAIAREVFDGRAGSGNQLTDEESGMTPAIWRNYDPRLQSPSWHERFAALPGDNRQSLTWRNRFIGAVPKIHSFYSPTEDALGSYDGEVPSTSLGAAAVVVMNGAAFTAYVWVYQEKAKGNRQDYYLPFLGSFHAGSTYAGWSMNIKDPVLSGDPTHWKWVNSPDYVGRMIKTSAEIGNVSDSVLRRHPVFEPGWGVVRNQEQQEIPVSNVSPVSNAPGWIYDLYGATSGSSLVGGTTSANRAQLLAEAIPAQSWAVGSHQLNTSTLPITKQHNMPVEYAETGWPRPTVNGVREWRHSDMREVAYLYQSRFWDALVSVSQQP